MSTSAETVVMDDNSNNWPCSSTYCAPGVYAAGDLGPGSIVLKLPELSVGQLSSTSVFTFSVIFFLKYLFIFKQPFINQVSALAKL